MRLFMTISEGDDADEATPIVATSDEVAIRAAVTALSRRFGVGESNVTPVKRPPEPEGTISE